MKKLLIIIMLLLAIQLFGNHVEKYGNYKNIKYRDFQNKKYKNELLQLITFIDIENYFIGTKAIRKEYTLHGFNLYGLYFCLSNKKERDILFNPTISDGLFSVTLFHNMGIEISEMLNPIIIEKKKNHLIFYEGDKYIFEIIF